MPLQSYDSFQHLTDLIEREDVDFLTELSADSFGPNPKKRTRAEILARTTREKIYNLALRSLRLLVNLEILSRGDGQFLENFRTDFDEATDALSWLTGEYQISEDVISQTVELVLLTDPGRRAPLLQYLRSHLGITVRNFREPDSEFFSVALDVLRYYLKNGLVGEFSAAAQGLITLSDACNARKPVLHRAVVTQCLRLLVDVDAALTLEICKTQNFRYRDSEDEHAAEFYWYYGYASQVMGQHEEALPILLRCSKLCMQVEGENSWLAARALQLYHRILLESDATGESERFLWDSLKKAEENYYTVTGEQVETVSAFLRYDLLSIQMDKQVLRNHYSQIRKHLEFCRTHEDRIRHPRMTLRAATNLLSAYYLEIGDYLQAEQKMYTALETLPPEGVAKMPSDDLVLSNLLQIYANLNDREQLEKLADILAEKLDNDALSNFERYRYFVLVQSAYAQLGYSMEHVIQDFRDSLMEIHQAMRSGNTEELVEGGTPGAYGVVAMIATLGDVFSSTREELRCYQELLRYFLDHPEIFCFNNNQYMVLYQELARINWGLNDLVALHYMQKSLEYGSNIVDCNNNKITNRRIASLIYYNMGYPGTAAAIAEESLKNITDAWRNVISYINNRRIRQILAITQENYNVFYAVISSRNRPEYSYDQLLRYKDLPSLVGRERNRYLNGDLVDKKLRDRVYELQDKLARAQMDDALRGVDTVSEISRELQQAEVEFAGKFPRNISYTEISFARVGEKLKENEALVEYYFTPCRSSLLGTPEHIGEVHELDVFVITKNCGQVNLSHARLPDGNRILEDAAAFTDTMHNPDTSQWIGEKELLRERLYSTLLNFTRDLPDQVTTLYIAPDLGLCNLPFEILCAGDGEVLQEQFRVCRLVCGRDLLFFDDSTTGGGGAFVLGDPDFETELEKISEDRYRHAVGHLEPVKDLPFSRIEAQRVAGWCRTAPLVGKAATKYSLQQTLPSRVIHLATHGRFDEKLESDSLYSSYLIFAGYNRWVRNNIQSEHCGNGILTADEISRMDLRKTELVVLSACNSGMGDYSYRSVQGLLSAFSAAGVRWVISHIWDAGDFTTPILMDAFYKAYLSRGMDVPEALQYAKNYLRTVTVGQLRRDGWLYPELENRLSEATREELRILRRADDRRKPFMDESNWGGFVCYKCK